jgi:sporulation protein YlmC with PRC-barrel domain
MRTKLIIGGLLASVALSPAIAQQAPAPAPAPSPPAQRMEPTTPTQRTPMATTGQWRASKLVGVDVYNTANEKIGDIEEILIDASGKVTSVIIGVGGFLGIGQHDVQVQLSDLKFVNEPRGTANTTTTTTTTTTGAGTGGAPTRTVRAANEQWYPDHAIMNATKDQLKAMPAFKYN